MFRKWPEIINSFYIYIYTIYVIVSSVNYIFGPIVCELFFAEILIVPLNFCTSVAQYQ